MTLIQTTTPLTSNQEWDSSTFQTSNVESLTGTIYSDRACTLYIEQSTDGTNWDVSSSYTVPAADGKAVIETVVAPYFRVRLVNGVTAQTTLRLFINARSPSGAFVVDLSSLASPNEFFVVYFDGNGATKSIEGPNGNRKTWLATNELDAIGQAAIKNHTNGKYVAFNASTGVAGFAEINVGASAVSTTYTV